ncbi:hypothetical protein BSZ21_21020 [Bradyrhizobium canariense]|uniref:hypothetical protein n=1 Tax=Bradyrhizobium canariense TaxID=255045 RepID=UPI000A18C8EC|nr:hypothetical protein [Bradyrhizobium canariense]OSI65601.1 hypothetical protein BSZ21_21020 [Bradyrhizobium canariense]
MSTKRNQPSSLANRPWPFSSQDTPPLAWWRTLPSDKLRDAEKLLLLVTLERIEVLRGPAELHAAQRGDAAAAIAAALSVTPIQDFTLEVDIRMTALLRCAAEGDSAAALVLANLLGRTDLDLATELSASWFARHIHRSPHRRSFSTKEAELLNTLRERYAERGKGN